MKSHYAELPPIEIPPDYVLIKKGGRPPKTLRDIAVFIARQLKREELGKGYLADEWIIENFMLNDSGAVRSSRRNARNILTKRWLATNVDGRCIFVFPCDKDSTGNITVKAETIGWAWAAGLIEAIEVKMVNGYCLPGPAVPNSKNKWVSEPAKSNW